MKKRIFKPQKTFKMNRKIFTLLLFAILAISFNSTFAQTPRKPDPAGVTTGTSTDIDPTSLKVVDTIAKTKDTTLAAVNSSVKKLATAVSTVANADGKNKVAINLVWLLITGFLVFFMQAGFALVETGLTRAKNVAHTMAMNLFVYPAGVLGFFICGFALMFGGVGALGTPGGFDVLN